MVYYTGTPDNDTYTGGTGNDGINGVGGDDLLSGAGGQDTLFGGDGHDWIDGGSGDDIMGGGTGNDTFVVDSAGDSVLEGTNQGIDLVRASVTFSLVGRQIEFLTLTGAAHINATGNGFNNLLTGNSGNNVLDGGAGSDILAGGLGDDTYIVDAVSDEVAESNGEGVDAIWSSVSYSLAGRAVEDLTLTGAAHINATGNGLNNRLTGNSGNNLLEGGAGNDTLSGGTGDDTYIVDATGDDVAESDGEGADTIRSTVSYSLIGRAVETLVLTGGAHVDGTGNALNNILTGNTGNNALFGGDGDDVLDGGFAGADTLVGGMGDDTYYDRGGVIIELASQGTDTVITSRNISLEADYSALENVILTGTDNVYVTGNDLNNRITGNSGNNSLYSGKGNDTLIGGLGNDIFYIHDGGDVVIENAGEGTDEIVTTVTYSIADLPNIETINITHNLAVGITGNALNNAMRGNSSHNFLDGGAGDDTLTGGYGNDTYYVDSAGDVVVELSNGGTDTVVSTVSYSLLGTMLEHLTLMGTADVNGTGNARANVLNGNGGSNVLNGDAGNDTISGGAGDDTYYVNSAGDLVVENHYEGNDSIVSSVSYSLLGRAVEALILTGAGHLVATGNTLANVLTGNSGNNVLDGGEGKDTMSGGLGNDTYYVNSSYDVVNEASGQGNDRIYSSATFSLAGQFAEVLILTGTGNADATGNNLGNLLVGNDGDNVLDGWGGADTLQGGAGDDIYYLGLETNDVVIETAGGGNDTIHSSARSFSLVGLQVENLRMRGDSLFGDGNELDNRIVGNGYSNIMTGGDGNDTLDGGAANDVMTGGTGDDVYYVGSLYDVVNENAGEGIDWVMGGNGQALAANVENLTLLNANNGNAIGNDLDNRLQGNIGNNAMTGGGGADLFVFIQDSGIDKIADLNTGEGDRIDISAYTHGEASQALVSQSGSDVVIDLGDGNTVLIVTDTVDNVVSSIIW